jgi:hypothetical protein
MQNAFGAIQNLKSFVQRGVFVWVEICSSTGTFIDWINTIYAA